jgi:hypothetical protein
MFAIVLTILVSLGLAVLLAALLPGAGLVGAALLIAAGIGLVAWLVASGASGRAAGGAARDAEKPELLGPGGPDDPRHP